MPDRIVTKGYMLKGPNYKQGLKRGWFVFPEPKNTGEWEPVTIVRGHIKELEKDA